MLKESSTDNNILYLIFVFLISSTLFVELRFLNLPLGFPEIFIIVIGIYIIFKNLKFINYNFFINNLLLKFWILSFILLFLGFLISSFTGTLVETKFIIHDLCAYIFIFFLLVIMHLLKCQINNQIENFERVVFFMMMFYTILFIIFMIFENYIPFNKGSDLMLRYLVLSDNPNQLAIIFTIIPFMLIFFNKNLQKDYFLEKTFWLVILSLYIGSRISSDALNIGWGIGIFVYFILIYLTKYNNFKINFLLGTIFIILCILIILNLKEIIYFIDGGRSSSDARIDLIINAFNNLKEMIYFGFGPGPHSYADIDGTMYWEVHNTYIDWFTQVGIFGILFFFYLIYKTLKGLYIKKEFILIAAFVSLLVFITFHFVFRQPIFWFFLYFFYIMSQGDKKCAE